MLVTAKSGPGDHPDSDPIVASTGSLTEIRRLTTLILGGWSVTLRVLGAFCINLSERKLEREER